MATSPAAVSARIRRAGFVMTDSYIRPGVKVSRSWRRGLVSVEVISDYHRRAVNAADELEHLFVTWGGYKINRPTDTSFTIEKED